MLSYKTVGCWLAVGVGLVSPLLAGEAERVTIRGQTLDVWPVEDLVARGFDVPSVPKEKNAAWIYIEASNAYVDLPDAVDEAFAYAIKTAWPDGQEELTDYLLLPGNRRAMELVVKGTAMPLCSMPYFGSPSESVLSVLLPNLSHARFLSKLMVVDGRRLEAEKKYDEALKRYLTVMRMGIHIEGGFTLIEGLVGFAIWAVSEQAAMDMVGWRTLSLTQLKKLQSELNKLAENRPSVKRGLLGEQAFGPAIIDELCSRPFAFFGNLRSYGMEFSGVGSATGSFNTNPTDGWGELELRVGRLIYPDRVMKRHLRGYYEKVIEEDRRGPVLARQMEFDEDHYIREVVPKWDMLPRILLPSLSRAIALGVRLKTEFAAFRAMVGLRIHTLENDGQPPPRIEDVAELLPEHALIDPYSGDLLIYRPTEQGWILYSVGPDLTDDGGQKGASWEELDFVFEYPPAPVEPFGKGGDKE